MFPAHHPAFRSAPGSLLIFNLVISLACISHGASERGATRLLHAETKPHNLPGLRHVPKPADRAIERRAHPQPTVPEGAKEIPFVETAAEPVLTGAEKERGYVLFQRPIIESVYPNTRPLPDERIDALTAFATPGEFEPVTFALYPARPLQNLKVRASALSCASGQIPAERVDVRLA